MLQESITPRSPPIENMILAGLTQSLEQALRIPSERILFVASTDRLKIAQRIAQLAGGPEGKVVWPYLFVHMNSVTNGIEAQKHAYNARSLARHGVYTKVADGQLKVRKVHLIPSVFEFEVIYMVDEWSSAFAFANNWIAQSANNRCNFTITYGGTGIDIRVEMATSMSTPDQEASVEQPNVFEYTSTLQVVGYITDPHPDGESEIQLLRKPVVNVTMDDPKNPDPKVWSGRHQMPITKDKQR